MASAPQREARCRRMTRLLLSAVAAVMAQASNCSLSDPEHLRLAATLRRDGDAIAAALNAGVDWNSLGVAWPRKALRRLPAAFAALVANCVEINFGRHA